MSFINGRKSKTIFPIVSQFPCLLGHPEVKMFAKKNVQKKIKYTFLKSRLPMSCHLKYAKTFYCEVPQIIYIFIASRYKYMINNERIRGDEDD